MKYSSLLTVLAFLVVSAGSAFAQNQEQVTVSAEATVEAALDLASENVQFGTVQQGINSYLPAGDGDDNTAVNLGGGASAGSLTIKGTDEVNIIVTFNTSVTLTGGTGDDLTYEPAIYTFGTGSEDGTEVQSGTAFEIDHSQGGAADEMVLGIGGDLTVPGNSLGTFDEDFTIEVQYEV